MKAFLIAGEPSGDRLGGALMSGLKQLCPDIEFIGVGGALMTDQGLASLFPMEELSVMGIAEVLPKYRHLTRRIQQTADAVIQAVPDVLITIDSPDFCLRVSRKVREAAPDILITHYVAPSVWAWRPGRAQKMAKSVDQVLALLPFEPPFMEAAGMRCDFVGHPVTTEPQATDAEIAAFRDAKDLGRAPIILVLPGSRQAEVSRLSSIFGEALRPVLTAHPDARVVVPATGPVASFVQDAVRNWPGSPIVLDPNSTSSEKAQLHKRAAFGAATVALATSGTVSLELAASATPMVIAYDMNWLSWQIMARMAKIDTVTLVNLVTETRTVPEYLGPDCKSDAIAKGLTSLISEPTARQSQLDAMAVTMARLGRGGEAPGLRAARAVLDALGKA